MICKEYDQLSHIEKVEFIGKLIHAVQNDTESFFEALSIVDKAHEDGIFDKVTINPYNYGKTEVQEISKTS